MKKMMMLEDDDRELLNTPLKDLALIMAISTDKGAMLDGMSVKGWHFIPRAARKPATPTTPRDVTTASIDARDHANAILDGLSERHAWILGAYYLDGWTQEQIGRVLGISGSAVSQSMKTALRRLRRAHG